MRKLKTRGENNKGLRFNDRQSIVSSKDDDEQVVRKERQPWWKRETNEKELFRDFPT